MAPILTIVISTVARMQELFLIYGIALARVLRATMFGVTDISSAIPWCMSPALAAAVALALREE